MQQPAWLEPAWRELGESERAGAAHNARILALYRDAGHGEISADEVAWCAAFAGACLERAKVACTRSLMARSYLAWGEPIKDGRLGAVAVFSRGSDTSQGHVGFWVGETEDSIMLLGGNQSDAVSVMPVAKARLLAQMAERKCGGGPAPGAPSANDATLLARAHVLEMEGGYTEDPHDPGGPTNFGIILSEFAAWKGERLDAANTRAAQGRAEAHRRADRARHLFRQLLASRGLRRAAGCARRSCISMRRSITASARPSAFCSRRSAPVWTERSVPRHAPPFSARRWRMRLPPTPSFGVVAIGLSSISGASAADGCRRVDVTLDRARKLIDAGQNSQPQQQGEADMTETSNETTTKWWGHSITIWGTIVSALAVVVPAVGPAVGVDISGDLVQNAGDDVVSAVQAVAALVGTLMTIYGRVRATQPITRRTLNLKI